MELYLDGIVLNYNNQSIYPLNNNYKNLEEICSLSSICIYEVINNAM